MQGVITVFIDGRGIFFFPSKNGWTTKERYVIVSTKVHYLSQLVFCNTITIKKCAALAGQRVCINGVCAVPKPPTLDFVVRGKPYFTIRKRYNPSARQGCDLTSSLGHPKIFVKEFFNGFVSFHDHCSGEKLTVEWQTDLYGRHCLSHSQHLVYA